MMKIKIESPLVTITFEDQYIMGSDGYTKHNLPDVKDTIKNMTKACEQIIHETIRAQKYGVIDLKKWEIPENSDKINVILEK